MPNQEQSCLAVLCSALIYLTLKGSWEAAAAFAVASLLYGFVGFMNRRSKIEFEAFEEEMRRELKALKERTDSLTFSRGLAR